MISEAPSQRVRNRLSEHGNFARSQGEAQFPGFWRGLLGAWNMSMSAKGRTTVRDFSNVGNPATLVNGATWGANGVSLDGVDQLIEVADDASLDSPKLTCMFRVRHTGVSSGFADGYFMKVSAGTWQDGYGAYHTSGNVNYFIGNWSTGKLVVPFTFDNDWHVCVMRYDGANLTGAMDGRLVPGSTAVATDPTTSGSLQIGKSRGTAEQYTIEAEFSHFYLWDRAFSDNEMLAIMREPDAPFLKKRKFNVLVPVAGTSNPPIFMHSYRRRRV